MKIPVFIAVGLGGKGNSPESVYIVPLHTVESNFVNISELIKHEKKEDKNFYFHVETLTLK